MSTAQTSLETFFGSFETALNCWGTYTAYSAVLLRRYSPLTVAAYTTLVAGLAVLAVASPQLMDMHWTDVGAWAAALYSALFVVAFGFTSWQRGISRIGAT